MCNNHFRQPQSRTILASVAASGSKRYPVDVFHIALGNRYQIQPSRVATEALPVLLQKVRKSICTKRGQQVYLVETGYGNLRPIGKERTPPTPSKVDIDPMSKTNLCHLSLPSREAIRDSGFTWFKMQTGCFLLVLSFVKSRYESGRRRIRRL